MDAGDREITSSTAFDFSREIVDSSLSGLFSYTQKGTYETPIHDPDTPRRIAGDGTSNSPRSRGSIGREWSSTSWRESILRRTWMFELSRVGVPLLLFRQPQRPSNVRRRHRSRTQRPMGLLSSIRFEVRSPSDPRSLEASGTEEAKNLCRRLFRNRRRGSR